MIEVRIPFVALHHLRHEKLQNAYINEKIARAGIPIRGTPVLNTGAPYQQIRDGALVWNDIGETMELVLWWYSEEEIERYRRYREYWSWHGRFPRTRGIRPWTRHPRKFPYPIGLNLTLDPGQERSVLDRSRYRIAQEMIAYSYIYRASKGLL